jgi:hypothetical protein
MRFVLILFLAQIGFFSFGQYILPIQHDTNTYNHEIIAHGITEYSSTSVQNEMGKMLLFGGHITDDIKNRTFDAHRGINRFGLDASAEIEYRNLKASIFKEKWGFTVKAGYYNYMSVLYSKELFGLSFFGNEKYLGENVDFSGSRFQAMSFQKIGFGFIDKKSKSNVSLNVYSISNYAEINVREGHLFQSENGDSISLTLDGNLDYTSESNFLKGFGAGIDLDFRIPVVLRNEKVSYVQFLAKNLGFAKMTSTVTRYRTDTTFTYDGLTFDQLYGDASIFNEDFSILDTLGVDSLSVSKYKALPGFMQAGKIVDDLNKARVQSFFGIRIYPSITYSPLIYAGAQFKTTKWLDLGANASYGGFSGFRAGIYGNVRMKNFSLGISSEDVIGFVSKKAKGQSLIVRLRCRF